MIICYLLALLFSIASIILCVVNKKVVWWESLISIAASFAIVGIIHACVINGMTADTETWSGKLTRVVHHPKWVEKYQVAIYKTETYTTTTGFGKNRRTVTGTRSVFSHYETRYRTHPEHWVAHANFGKKSTIYNIDKGKYNRIRIAFGNKIDISQPYKSGFYEGDKNLYTVMNRTNHIHPTNMTVKFENRVKAAPSVFSFTKVPENVPVYKYPKSTNWDRSARLVGDSKNKIGIKEWDQLNSRLGPYKKVNVILVGFTSKDSGLGQLQEAKWIGGKKNDLVLCYGDDWSYVFGWTERETVKRNLETILLKNKVDRDIIDPIEKEIHKNYEIKDWDKFAYISVEPPMWSYYLVIGFLVASQVGLYFFAVKNGVDKGNKKKEMKRRGLYVH
jgi:hypothetical protein